jgi:hypothetical protein
MEIEALTPVPASALGVRLESACGVTASAIEQDRDDHATELALDATSPAHPLTRPDSDWRGVGRSAGVAPYAPHWAAAYDPLEVMDGGPTARTSRSLTVAEAAWRSAACTSTFAARLCMLDLDKGAFNRALEGAGVGYGVRSVVVVQPRGPTYETPLRVGSG